MLFTTKVTNAYVLKNAKLLKFQQLCIGWVGVFDWQET